MRFPLLILAFGFVGFACAEASVATRHLLADLALDRVDDKEAALEELASSGEPMIKEFVDAWRTGEVYSYEQDNGSLIALQRVSEEYRRLDSWQVEVVSAENEAHLTKVRPSRSLRRKLAEVTDTIDLASPDRRARREAALKLGRSGDPDYLPHLRRRFETEEDPGVRRVFEEAIMISLLSNAKSDEERVEAVTRLGELKSIAARDPIAHILSQAKADGDKALESAAETASLRIANYEEVIRHAGSFFRGLSTGSVLLMVAFGLAITFGLMGIINLAHGEFLAIGGYTCYVVQNFFAGSFGVQSNAYQWYFWVALPICFIVAGGIGLVLEKGFIRFLYKRPLESLLATWGLSMVMQQGFRLIFGAANVSVSTPEMLGGNLEFGGFAMSYARIFVICFAVFVCFITWALLSKTNLGLYIRAVMQNRRMASSLGIPVARVNAMTFAFGCGLAALAGAALTQIGNIGPTMGQTYIVDSFMVVVAGGVGNLLGAGFSAMGIGVVDQLLQPVVGPVMGKITVFFAIILFLQWKPGGLFPTKSRSMED